MKNILAVIFLAIVLIAVFFILISFDYFQNSGKDAILFQDIEEDLLENLTLDQKIGQLFIIGIKGTNLTSETEALIKKVHPGGILLLGRNVEDRNQLKELINSLQKVALEDTGIPLFISVDQEGGIISRIDWVDKTPQSEIENVQQARQIGKQRGQGLKELGINLNLAPLMDIVYESDYLFERGFQEDINQIRELSNAIIQGQKEKGILTCVKHFPGYGGISFNPEEKLATLDSIPETSQFQNLESSPEIIMLSNVVYPDLDEMPFSFSEKGIQYLRDNIDGSYLIMSDDLSQNSLLDQFPLNQIVSAPFNAGVDILIFSGWREDVEKGISVFKQEVEDGNIPEIRINESVSKIIKLKKEFNDKKDN